MRYVYPVSKWMFSAAVAVALALSPNFGMGSPAMISPEALPSLIPAPASWQASGGVFYLDDLNRLAASEDLLVVATRAAARLEPVLDRVLPVLSAGSDGDLAGSLSFLEMPAGSAEQYELRITDQGVQLSATDPAGFQHGISTLIQMALNGKTPAERTSLPTGVIKDQPRFGWRGMLLDCGRHFMPVESIKELLDKLALHKFNVLHWHLTEDQGWRLEIPGYPRLTEIGAWRTEPDGSVYGGFYTAADVREILDYAAERSITVVPEIELPGHSQAALAAYPELSCTGGPFEVQTQWGIHEDVFCAGREETFTFLEDVLTYVMELFGGRYIHIGGDEVPKDRWKDCDHCQARIRSEGLKGEDDLQSWFIGRIGTFLEGRGHRLIGWDEILAGGLPGDPATYTVQAWRGLEYAAEAARDGHDVIVSPTSHAYFDYDPGVLDLRQVFDFRPIPPGLDEVEAAHILGGQMNLWTEYIPPERVDTMLFPRLTAMAEALWTGADDRDFGAFLDRLDGHGPVLEWLNVRPGAAARPVVLSGRFDADNRNHRLNATLDENLAAALPDRDFTTRYLVLESPFPSSFQPGIMPEDQDLPPVTSANDTLPEILEIPSGDRLDSSWLALAQMFLDDRPYGAPALLEISGHAAVGAGIDFVHSPSEKYPGGGIDGLVNGLHGSRFFRDEMWTGFEGTDLDATIDLGQARDLHSVSVRFLQDANAWILLPREVRFSWSTDGENWREAGTITHSVSDRVQDKLVHEFAVEWTETGVRYIRIHALTPGICPDWHPGHGKPCWIFADEIVCR